jgi:molybdate transport system regulatory protein
MEIRSKIWLEVDGETVFGSGRRALLDEIEELGSINKAAKKVNISYRKALSYIQSMERRLGVRLVDRKAGGRNGGGAVLTAEAKKLLLRYKILEDGINVLLDKKFMEVFGSKKSYINKLKLSGRIYDKNGFGS